MTLAQSSQGKRTVLLLADGLLLMGLCIVLAVGESDTPTWGLRIGGGIAALAGGGCVYLVLQTGIAGIKVVGFAALLVVFGLLLLIIPGTLRSTVTWVLGIAVLAWGGSRYAAISPEDTPLARWALISLMVAAIVLGLVMLIFNGMGTFLVPLVLGAYLVTSSPVGSQLVEDVPEIVSAFRE